LQFSSGNIANELRDEVMATISGHEPISPKEMENVTKKRIRYTKNLLDKGELDEREARLMFAYLLEALVNSKMSRIGEKFTRKAVGSAILGKF